MEGVIGGELAAGSVNRADEERRMVSVSVMVALGRKSKKWNENESRRSIRVELISSKRYYIDVNCILTFNFKHHLSSLGGRAIALPRRPCGSMAKSDAMGTLLRSPIAANIKMKMLS